MMKFSFRFCLSLLVLAICFSACQDDEPAPNPESYLKYSGQVYELKSAAYEYLPDDERKLFLEFSTLTREEIQRNNEQGSSVKGSWIQLAIISTVDRQIVAGTYPIVKEQSEDSSISAINFFIAMDSESQSGILISPVSGEMIISDTAEGKSVIFNFLAPNGEKVTGMFQGDIVNLLE